MRLAQLEYFLVVAEKLNFTEAAKALYISQPALSKQISIMEDELGAKLFDRNTRKVTLTPAGEYLFREISHLDEQLRLTLKRTGEIGRKENIKVACFDGAYTDDFLPTVYKHIIRAFPEADTSLVRRNFTEIINMLVNGEADLSLTLNIAYDENPALETKVIAKRQGAIFCSKDWEEFDFSKRDFLVMSKTVASRLYDNSVNNIARANIKPRAIKEVDNFATLITLIEMGMGFTILTEEVLENNNKLISIPLNNDTLGVDILAVWKKDNKKVKKIMNDFNTGA